MTQDLLDHRSLVDQGDQAQASTTPRTRQDVETKPRLGGAAHPDASTQLEPLTCVTQRVTVQSSGPVDSPQGPETTA